MDTLYLVDREIFLLCALIVLIYDIFYLFMWGWKYFSFDREDKGCSVLVWLFNSWGIVCFVIYLLM